MKHGSRNGSCVIAGFLPNIIRRASIDRIRLAKCKTSGWMGVDSQTPDFHRTNSLSVLRHQCLPAIFAKQYYRILAIAAMVITTTLRLKALSHNRPLISTFKVAFRGWCRSSLNQVVAFEEEGTGAVFRIRLATVTTVNDTSKDATYTMLQAVLNQAWQGMDGARKAKRSDMIVV